MPAQGLRRQPADKQAGLDGVELCAYISSVSQALRNPRYSGNVYSARQQAATGGSGSGAAPQDPPVAQATGAAAWAVGTQPEHLFQEEVEHPGVRLLEQGLARKDALGSKVCRRQAGQGVTQLEPHIAWAALLPGGALQVTGRPRATVQQVAGRSDPGPHELPHMRVSYMSVRDPSNALNYNRRNSSEAQHATQAPA